MKSALVILLFVVGCGGPKPTSLDPVASITEVPGSTPEYASRGLFHTGYAESSPIVWNGQIMFVAFEKQENNQVEIRDLQGNTVALRKWSRNLGCAIVVNNVLHIFGTDSNQTTIAESNTNDLVNWSDDIIVKTPSEQWQSLWNSSVAATDTDFVMAYEVRGGGSAGEYSSRIARSPDLVHWTDVGVLFSRKEAAAPMIRYVAGNFYLFFVSNEIQTGWLTYVARTKDFINYEQSSAPLLLPLPGEGLSNSDLDIIELDGTIYATYTDGNQTDSGDGDQCLATFKGSMRSFLEGLFQ